MFGRLITGSANRLGSFTPTGEYFCEIAVAIGSLLQNDQRSRSVRCYAGAAMMLFIPKSILMLQCFPLQNLPVPPEHECPRFPCGPPADARRRIYLGYGRRALLVMRMWSLFPMVPPRREA